MNLRAFSSLLVLATFAVLLPGLASGQPQPKKLIVNQEEVDCDLQGSAFVTPEGNIEIEVQDPDCLGTGGIAMSPLRLSPTSVSAGDSFTATWASVGADACELILPTGWFSPQVQTSDSVTLDVPAVAASGQQPVAVECIAANADPVFVDEFLTIGSTAAPDTPALLATVVDNIAPGEIRIDWSGSPDADSCQASSSPTLSGWNGSVSVAADQDKTLTGVPAGSYNLSLTCSNSNGTSSPATATASISGSQQCAGREPPAGWTRLGDPGTSACLHDGFSWDPSADCRVWWEEDEDGERLGIGRNPFYESGGATYRLAAAGRGSPKQYLAIRLDTFKTVEDGEGNETIVNMPATESGRWSAQAPNTFATSARTITTISSCPGDFHQNAVMGETGCYRKHDPFFQLYRWGGTSTSEDCQLESGKTYYLNIIPTLSPLGTDPDNFIIDANCDGQACGNIYSWGG